ncbi:laminin subunit alpha-4 isoform X1 [Paramisgurnus dabryanus]|uniref:laminin subunit alpha-4 isoform X1 n=1 Tax=Paramisgurnus dabryanus TaxID=90735 RepID=UPI0031F3D4D6
MASLVLRTVCILCILSVFVHKTFSQQQNTIYTVCARGFFLSEQNSCLPCNCKGHADSCEDITGICIECQDHTVGDFCDQCEDSFLPVFLPDNTFVCRPCACPLSLESNNFAAYCDKRGNFLRCVCQEGYAGHYCERCAPGYYGNPTQVGNSCKKCDCNGNSDPNLIFNECNNVTGQCLNCWANTAGDNCERCAPGFYGDAISARNCQECECNHCGTASCDDRTGVCHCKPGVTGRLCDRCEEGYSGFGSCMGCRRCECASAALRATCHPLTHTCQCRPGAGGRYCERCLPGYWDYSPSGCKMCNCKEKNCDMHTGECLPEASHISECNIDCDACIWNLIGDIRQSNKTLDQVRNTVLNISTGAAANDRLKYYNYTAHRLQAQFVGWRNKSAIMRADTGKVEEETHQLLNDMELLAEEEEIVKSLGDRVDQETLEGSTLAKTLSSNLTSLNVVLEEMIRDWELYSVHQELDLEVQKQKTAEAERILGWMRKLNLSPKEPLATTESKEASELFWRVRQLEKTLMTTQGHLSPVREVMGRFTSRLFQAQDLLNNADDAVQQTLMKYKNNQLKLQRRQAQQQRLIDTYDAVDQTIVMTKESISEANLTVIKVEDVVMRVREQHAEIDGAMMLLEKRTDKLSQSDRDLVLRAEEHTDELQRHAEELKYNLKGSDANGHVQKALSAFNVYDNIVKHIDDANITSLTSLNISSRTHDAIDGLKYQLDFMRPQSDNVFKEASSLRVEQQDVENTVLDNKKYIEETNEMMESSSKKLARIMNDINAIQKDRTPKRLQFTQEVAEGTLNRSAEVLEMVTPILQKVEEWNNNEKNDLYSPAALERTVQSAGEAVDDLTEVVPELLNKLHLVEEKRPVNNVSTNIMKIRELIAQARSIAKKVQVSMKFNGQSAVEVHSPTNVDELKTVTSISFYIRVDPDKDPIEDRFLLYLGDKQGQKDYMGLAIKNDNLVYVYNLGGDDVEIPLSSKPVSSWPPVFNLVKVERLGRHGKVFLTVPSQDTTAEQKFIQKGETDGIDSLFDLDPKDTIFVVGGVPPDVKLPPALTLAPFVGCIELENLNSDVISLYNFKQLHKMNVATSVPCSRHKLAFSQSRVTSYLFDGTGFALVTNIEGRGKIGVVTRFDIEVRTVSNNGILFLMVKEANFFVLELKNGFLRLIYDFGFTSGPIIMESDIAKLQINDARYHEVSVIYHHSKKIILLVDRSHVKSIENEKKTLPFSDIYIGGAPSHIKFPRPELSSLIGLKGCVKGFQFQKKDFNLLEEPGTIGISSGCPEESFMSRKAYFTGEGYLGSTAKISPFQSFEGGLNFRTLEANGLLFHHKEETNEFSLSLENGAVVLQSKGNRVRSHKKNYNDGKAHFLVATVTNQKYELIIDDKDKQEKNKSASTFESDNTANTAKTFYYGGSPTSSIQNFTGCISNAYISRQDRDIEPEDFQRYSENVKVSLQDCPVKRPAVTITKESRDSSRQKSRQKVRRDVSSLVRRSKRNRLDVPETGFTHSQIENTGVAKVIEDQHNLAFSQSRVTSYLFDGTGFALVTNIEERGKFGVVTIFDIEVRTVSNNGILFLMVKEANFFVLELKNGFLRLIYDFGFTSGPIIMENDKLQINDARYHKVSVIYHHSKKIILRVDRSHIKSIENEKKPLPFSDIYIGGAPSHIKFPRPELSSLIGLKGCVMSFKFQMHFFNLLMEPGTIGISSGCPEESFMSHKAYFTGEGYLGSTAKISPFQSFEGGLNFRTLQPNGLLFHHKEETNEFSLSLENGAVVLQFKGNTVRSHKNNYNDGETHFLVATVTNQKYELIIDDKDKEEKNKSASMFESDNTANTAKTFYYGGSPTSSIQNFTGCISNAYISRQDRDMEPEDFQSYSENVKVSLQDCPVKRPAVTITKESTDSSEQRPEHSHKVRRDVSSLVRCSKRNPLEVPETELASCHHYGGFAHSRHEYTGVAKVIEDQSHFSLSLKTQSAFGLIFYLADESEENFMTLFLTQGRLVFTFSTGEHHVRIRTKEKYSDGQWHDIIFIRRGNMGRLIIDGTTTLEESAPGGNISLLVQDPLYIGGVASERALKNIQKTSVYSFSGCVRSLQLNGRRLTSVSHSFGVTPCYEGPSEPGTYFTNEGGYVILDDSFHFDRRFELVMEVRPSVAAGVLLHLLIGQQEYLTMYIFQSQVYVMVNNGVGELSTYVSPRQEICDGNWHKITVIKDANVVQLDVDSEVNHVIVPFSETPQNTSSPVFIGGAPDSMLSHNLLSKRGYAGCIRNLSVNESPVSFSKAALVSGAVGVGTCPAA